MSDEITVFFMRCFYLELHGCEVMRVRRPTIFDAEVLLGPLAEPERSRRLYRPLRARYVTYDLYLQYIMHL